MCDISVKYIGINVYFVAEMCDLSVKDPGEKPSPESLCGEKPSGEKPSNFSSGENPSASFAACGENPSPFFLGGGGGGGGGGHVEKNPQFYKKPSNKFRHSVFYLIHINDFNNGYNILWVPLIVI